MEIPKLYTIGCPKCTVIKNKLNAKNIKFIESTNVEELARLGIRSLPVLKIGDKMMDFTTANNWVNKQEAK